MFKLKSHLKKIITIVLIFILYLILITLLNYLGFFKLLTIVKLNYIIVGIIMLIYGINIGRKQEKRAFLEGLKQSSIVTLILVIINLIFIRNFNLKTIIYYALIIVTATFGSMIGINLKKK